MFPTVAETLSEVCSCGRELCWRQLGLKPRKLYLLHVLWLVRKLFEQTTYSVLQRTVGQNLQLVNRRLWAEQINTSTAAKSKFTIKTANTSELWIHLGLYFKHVLYDFGYFADYNSRLQKIRIYYSIPGKGKKFFSSPKSPDRLWQPPGLQFKGYCGRLLSGGGGRGVKLTTPLHIVLHRPVWCGQGQL